MSSVPRILTFALTSLATGSMCFAEQNLRISADSKGIPVSPGSPFTAPFILEWNKPVRIGRLALAMGDDGSANLSEPSTGKIVWQVGGNQPNCRKYCKMVFQHDGNLVLYRETQKSTVPPSSSTQEQLAYWSSNTAPTKSSELRISNKQPYVLIMIGGHPRPVESLSGTSGSHASGQNCQGAQAGSGPVQNCEQIKEGHGNDIDSPKSLEGEN